MIIVSGMHRSGTSFISNILSEMGLDFGRWQDLLGADQWNQKGYYENKEIMMLNNSLIVGDSIDHNAWTVASHKRTLKTKLQLIQGQIKYYLVPSMKNILRQADTKKEKIAYLSKKYNNLTIKDPRFCYTLSAWKKYGKVDKVLFCYRDPLEVAKSLKKRNHLPLQLGYKIWKQHIEESFEQMKGTKVVTVNYNNFFDEKEKYNEMKRLYNFIGKKYNDKQARRILSKILDKKLKRQMRTKEKIPPRIREVYNKLQEVHKKYNKLKNFS